jgi:rRNA maturation protein Nop10
MVERIVKCNRCGKIIENPHPDRISIYKHSVEEYKDYFGKPNKKSVYKAEAPRHLCSECEIKFNEFWENKE